MATQTKIKRAYGKKRNFGDIIYNPSTKSVFCTINLGFFGKTTITLVKRQDDGAYDLMKAYTDSNDQEQVVCIGKTFPVKKKDRSIAEGLTQGTLGLLKRYDNQKQKEITDNSDALFITTHKLRENKPIGSSGLIKVGYISGRFGIEDDIAPNNGVVSDSDPEQSNVEYDDDNEEIPF